jgi:hypothetical protein
MKKVARSFFLVAIAAGWAIGFATGPQTIAIWRNLGLPGLLVSVILGVGSGLLIARECERTTLDKRGK